MYFIYIKIKDKYFKNIRELVNIKKTFNGGNPKVLSELIKNKYEVENLQLKISKPNILKDCVVSISS